MKANKIQWLVDGYEPFLPKDSVREIESFADGCPIITGLDGHKLILTKQKEYKLIYN